MIDDDAAALRVGHPKGVLEAREVDRSWSACDRTEGARTEGKVERILLRRAVTDAQGDTIPAGGQRVFSLRFESRCLVRGAVEVQVQPVPRDAIEVAVAE